MSARNLQDVIVVDDTKVCGRDFMCQQRRYNCARTPYMILFVGPC